MARCKCGTIRGKNANGYLFCPNCDRVLDYEVGFGVTLSDEGVVPRTPTPLDVKFDRYWDAQIAKEDQ